ncbi:MAG: hypothetical protein Q8O67_04730 [Deltaproteobacteria bacterium]|nr:hypothetical protein [Deltaproteobacteria bacterium]
MTKTMNGSNPATTECPPANAAGTIGYAGVASIDGDLPSFWTSVVRYRQRHGLADLKRQSGLIDDDDLLDLRDQSQPREFSFDPSPSNPSDT